MKDTICNNCKWTGELYELKTRIIIIHSEEHIKFLCPKCKSSDLYTKDTEEEDK